MVRAQGHLQLTLLGRSKLLLKWEWAEVGEQGGRARYTPAEALVILLCDWHVRDSSLAQQ